MNDGMIESPGYEPAVPDKKPRVIRIDRSNRNINVSAAIGYLAQSVNLASIAGSIQKGTHFVVQVPTHLQAALDAGKYTMLHGEDSGKTWATIVEKLPSGKNNFIDNCPIKKEAFYQGNPFQDISNSMANLQLQQQMAALAQMVGEAYDKILQVEAGQKADRIGQLIAGRDGIIYALKMRDEEGMKRDISIARGSLLEAQGKIGEVLRQKVMSFKVVPKSPAGQFAKEFIFSSYLSKQDEEYNTIAEYYDLYLNATELIAQSYVICGELDSAALVYDKCGQFIAGLDFSKVRTVLYAHKQLTAKDLFFYRSSKCIAKKKTLCLEAAKPYDYIEIDLDSEELMEAIRNGKQSEQE